MASTRDKEIYGPTDDELHPVAQGIYDSWRSTPANEDWCEAVHQVSITYCICPEEANVEDEVRQLARHVTDAARGKIWITPLLARYYAESLLGLAPHDVAVLALNIFYQRRREGKPEDRAQDWFNAQRECYRRAVSNGSRY